MTPTCISHENLIIIYHPVTQASLVCWIYVTQDSSESPENKCQGSGSIYVPESTVKLSVTKAQEMDRLAEPSPHV